MEQCEVKGQSTWFVWMTWFIIIIIIIIIIITTAKALAKKSSSTVSQVQHSESSSPCTIPFLSTFFSGLRRLRTRRRKFSRQKPWAFKLENGEATAKCLEHLDKWDVLVHVEKKCLAQDRIFENDIDFLARKERMLAVKRRQCPLYSCQFLKVGGTVAQSRSSRFQNAKTRQNARCPQPQMPWQCMELRGADSVDSDSEDFFLYISWSAQHYCTIYHCFYYVIIYVYIYKHTCDIYILLRFAIMFLMYLYDFVGGVCEVTSVPVPPIGSQATRWERWSQFWWKCLWKTKNRPSRPQKETYITRLPPIHLQVQNWNC